jgi:hypothetical protein
VKYNGEYSRAAACAEEMRAVQPAGNRLLQVLAAAHLLPGGA